MIMRARSIGSTTIKIADLEFPALLYTTGTTSKPNDPKLIALHASDHGRAVNKLVCTTCNAFLEQADTIKACEHESGKQVALTSDDLATLDVLNKSLVAIDQLVPVDAFRSPFVDKSFWIGATKGGEKSFRLFLELLKTDGLTALGSHTANRHTYMASISVHEDALLLQQHRFAHQTVRGTAVPVLPTHKITPTERSAFSKLAAPLRHSNADIAHYRDVVGDEVNDFLRTAATAPPITARSPDAA